MDLWRPDPSHWGRGQAGATLVEQPKWLEENVDTWASQTDSRREAVQHPIVVGVDGGGRSTSAVVWAVEEAQRTGHGLLLVNGRDESRYSADRPGNAASLARRLTLRDVQYVESDLAAPEALLAAADEASLVVVGHRGRIGVEHLRIGSTAADVVGRARVPVVVVPESWIQPTQCASPLLVGLAHRADRNDVMDPAILGFAFERARKMQVPLLVVNARTAPHLDPRTVPVIAAARDEQEEGVRARLKEWRNRYPEVDVELRFPALPPADALLEASVDTQLVVVGRDRGTTHGRANGSAVRAILRESRRPLAVVPVPGPVKEPPPTMSPIY